MRKVFIDVGVGNGDDLLNFRKNNKDYIYYGIDASLNYLKRWEELKKLGIEFINKVAWTYNGLIKFYEEKNDNPQGSTLIQDKKNKNSEMIEVECFDFSEWIKQFKDDYVVVNMDIEGAEYEVLDKMIKNKTIFFIDKLYYENHGHKIDDNGKSIKKAKEITKQLKKLRINFTNESI